jgi:hypothetical protein
MAVPSSSRTKHIKHSETTKIQCRIPDINSGFVCLSYFQTMSMKFLLNPQLGRYFHICQCFIIFADSLNKNFKYWLKFTYKQTHSFSPLPSSVLVSLPYSSLWSTATTAGAAILLYCVHKKPQIFCSFGMETCINMPKNFSECLTLSFKDSYFGHGFKE